MNKAITHLLALAALASSQVLLADVQAISCHGCSSSAKSQAATDATSRGKVYVFDQERATVSTFSVYSEVLDTRPRTTWKQARQLQTDPALQTRYRALVEAQEDIADIGTIYLPPNFAVGSVANALLDPAYSSTAIEDYLANLNQWSALNQATISLVSRVTQLDLGIIDLKDIINNLLVKVQFPDNSDLSYELQISLNTGNNEFRIELKPFGNAHGPDGQALPTHRISLRGRTFSDHNGSMAGWIAYVRSLGAIVRRIGGGGSGNTVMECDVIGNEIYCTVLLVQ